MNLDIHENYCKRDCKLNCGPMKYEFEFLYQTHIANVFPCVRGDGIPHKDILDNGVKQIMDKLSISYNDDHYPFTWERGSLMSFIGNWSGPIIQRQRELGLVNEVIKVGGFSTIYYYEHKINKIREMDIQKIINNCGNEYDNNLGNILNMLMVLNLKKEYKTLVKTCGLDNNSLFKI